MTPGNNEEATCAEGSSSSPGDTTELVSVWEEVRRLAAASSGDAADAANAAVSRLSDKDLQEIRTLRCPPAVVRRTLEATWLVLNAGKGASVAQAPPTWLRVQKMLLDTNLVGRMRDFDASALKAEPVLAAYIVSEYFSAGEKYQRSPARSSTSYQRLLISRPSSSSTGGSPVGAAAMV
ncbi:unnamed protein product, partial [Polarella glacialis]